MSENIVFVHGPSGAGKGAGIEELTKYYSELGYKIISVASGDLYRAAGNDPIIKENMRLGKYIDTLGAIIPGLQDYYCQYQRAKEEMDGKAVLILDGFVRRDAFTRADGTEVESQVDQIARAFMDGNTNFDEARKKVLGARHILVDIDPRDAIEQMKIRVNRETDSIARHAMQYEESILPEEIMNETYLLGAKISTLIGSDESPKEAQKSLRAEAENLRSKISEMLGIPGIKYYSDFFKALEIKSNLRDDDIEPESREQRVSGNYVKQVEGIDGEKSYELGFAAHALVDSLGYKFDATEGTFSSELPNLDVVINGKSRGISFSPFKQSFRKIARNLCDSQVVNVETEMSFGPSPESR